MSDFFVNLFDTSDFPARWYCGNWTDFLGWLHILSDLSIAIAYFAIPFVLIYFTRRRSDVPFSKIFLLFAAFILACGTVHLVEAIIFWFPIYRVSGLMKFITSVVSLATVVALIRITPEFLHLPSVAAANEKLRREIQQRKSIERELREAKERQDVILEATTSIIWTTDVNGAFTTPQPSWQRYTGQAWEDCKGFGWSQALHEDDRQRILRRWDETVGEGRSYSISGRLWHAPTQEYRRFVAEAVPVRNEDGSIREWVGAVEDVELQLRMETTLGTVQSELANQQRELELIYETAPVGMSLIDRDLRYLRINDRLADINGLPRDAHLGRRVDELLGELIDVLKPIYERVFETNQPVLDVEIAGKTPASLEERVWLTSFFPLQLPTNQTVGESSSALTVRAVTTTVQDITELKKQEQRLQKSEREAQAANRAKSAFLANMSHEIRTPLASILGYADVLLEDLQDKKSREFVTTLKRNGEYLLELINDILDLSRIEAEKLDVELEICNLADLLTGLESLMQVRAGEKQIKFSVNVDEHLPKQIRTDPRRLRQVLINLIGNAIKFTDDGEVNVQARYFSDKEAIEFEINDTGIGIDDEQLATLFEPFAQGSTELRQKYGGSGLGLAISQRLIHLLKGEIHMNSRLGKGTTFFVHIPATIDEPTASVRHDSTLEEPVTAASASPSKELVLDCRLLVVDDRRDVRYISQRILTKAGASVEIAEDGRQAIEMTLSAQSSGQPYDLILMDVQMPVLDGLQATSQLRAAGIQTPIIALTADAMRGDRDRCLNSGCDDYLSKPIQARELLAKVHIYTQQKSIRELHRLRTQRAERMPDSDDLDSSTA